VSDAWYLDADDYYVPAAVAGEYPTRQGDLIAGPAAAGDDRWLAAQIVHPTCELTKDSVKEVQVARVRPLSDLDDDFLRGLVVAGYSERDGQRRVALAHTFFLPPWAANGEPCFANFREMATVPRKSPGPASSERLAAITHECRVSFIRRWLYFRFRLAFGTDQVRNWEAVRISADPTFAGPKPEWALG
jgi:hypothetical protein